MTARAMMVAPRSKIVVTLSGEVITDADAPAPVEVRVRFNSDGTVDRFLSSVGTYQQRDSGTDWRIPNAGGTGVFHVKAELNAQEGTGNRVGALSSWLALSSDREWTLEEPSSSQTVTWDLDISISDDGGATTIVTALYELTAQVV